MDDHRLYVLPIAGLFGIAVGAAQFPALRQLFPAVTAPRWIFATAVGWSIDGVMQGFWYGPVCWLLIYLWLGPIIWLFQWKMLRPGMPTAAVWILATIIVRWDVNSPVFDGLREPFAVVGGPLAMAGMGATLGAAHDAITGGVLLLIVPSSTTVDRASNQDGLPS